MELAHRHLDRRGKRSTRTVIMSQDGQNFMTYIEGKSKRTK
jgi:hypothetical protein